MSIVRRKGDIFEVVQLQIQFDDPEDSENFYFSFFNRKQYSMSNVDEDTPITCHVALSKFLLLSFGNCILIEFYFNFSAELKGRRC